jgi:hypothetical protein
MKITLHMSSRYMMRQKPVAIGGIPVLVAFRAGSMNRNFIAG